MVTTDTPSTALDPHLQTAREHLERARAAQTDYHPEVARTELEAAEHALGDDDSTAALDLRLRLRLTRAWAMGEVDLPSTTRALDGIADDAVAAGLDAVAALARLQQGTLFARAGDLERALAAMRACSPHEHALDVDERARLLLNRGTLASMLLDASAAAADLAQAATVAIEASNTTLAFMAVHNQGYAEFLKGDLPAALRLMGEAEAMDVPIDRSPAQHDRARILMESGLVAEASEGLQQAIEGLTAAGMPHEATLAELDLARCEMLLGRPEAAALRAEALASRFVDLGAPTRAVEARVLRLEALAWGPSAAGEVGEAIDVAAAGERLGGRLKLASAALLARCLDAAGRTAEASAAIENARGLSTATHLATRCLGRRVAAEHDLASGDLAAARRTLRAAAADLHELSRGVSSLDLRTGMSLHLAALGTRDIGLAIDTARPWQVIAASERWRNLVGSQPRLTVHDPGEAALWARLRALRDELRTAEGDAAEDLRRGVRTVMGELKRWTWSRRTDAAGDPLLGRPPLARPVTLAELRAAAAARHTTVITLVSDGARLVAVVVHGSRSRLVSLGEVGPANRLARRASADLEALSLLPRAAAALRSGIQASLTEVASQLDVLLVRPLGHVADRVVVVPTRNLAAIPWSLLPGLAGRAVQVALTATAWTRQATTVDGPAAAVLRGPELHSGEHEQAAIAGVWGAAVTGVAQGHDLVAAIGAADLVHVAAHGHHEADNPLFSSLLMADGPVFVHELEGRAVAASHVVLSACQAGRVRVRPGDEPLGITAALMAFGVGTVVAPVSVVDENLAASTMERYHRGLASGRDAAEALAEAREPGGMAAAAFTCFGAPWRVEGDG